MGFPAPADSPLVTRVVASPNFRARQDGERVAYIILHSTWMADDAAVIARLCDPAVEVSSHYFVTHEMEGGVDIIQLVGEENVAWHAGRSSWQGRENLNGWALGIEIGNGGPFATPPTKETEAVITPEMWAAAEPYTETQYAAVIALVKDLLARHELGPEAVLGHDEIAPGRKSDPGRHFDWERLVAAGVAVKRPR